MINTSVLVFFSWVYLNVLCFVTFHHYFSLVVARVDAQFYLPFSAELVGVCRQALQWLVCWLCHKTSAELSAQLASGLDQFTVRNNIQVHLAHTLSLAYVKVGMLGFFNILKEKLKQEDMGLRKEILRVRKKKFWEWGRRKGNYYFVHGFLWICNNTSVILTQKC